MKQGNNCLLPIRVSGIDPGLVESIQLKFQQGEVVRKVAYPSDETTLKGNIVYITWTHPGKAEGTTSSTRSGSSQRRRG